MKLYVLAILLAVVCVTQAQQVNTTTSTVTTTKATTKTSTASSTSKATTTATSRATTTASSTASSTSRATTTAASNATSTSRATTTAASNATSTSRATTTAASNATSTSRATTTAASNATSTSRATTTAASTATSTGRATTTASSASSTSTGASNTSSPSTGSSTGSSGTPSTTFAPTTPQPSGQQNFSCRAGNATRFRLTGTFALSIKYNATDGTRTAYINVPQARNTSTSCSSNTTETLTFEFFNGWSIEYSFQVVEHVHLQASANDQYYISNITVIYIHDEHLPNSSTPNVRSKAPYGSNDYLQTSAGGYYSCKANITLDINQVTLFTTDFKYRAFNDNGDIDFNSGSPTKECDEDEETSSIVPIAVGAALAGLVIIVLIAYLIGRKRARKTGYENV